MAIDLSGSGRVETSEQIAAKITRLAARATADAANDWLEKVYETAVSLAPIGPPFYKLAEGLTAGKASNVHLARAQEAGEFHPGWLRASGQIEDVDEQEVLEGHPTGKVFFDAVYAARQHEETTWWHPHGGQAKYLETAVKLHLPDLEPTVAKALETTLSGRPLPARVPKGRPGAGRFTKSL